MAWATGDQAQRYIGEPNDAGGRIERRHAASPNPGWADHDAAFRPAVPDTDEHGAGQRPGHARAWAYPCRDRLRGVMAEN